MTTSRHLMLDLETFSIAPNAFVWEVGLMPFTFTIQEGTMFVELGTAGRYVLSPWRHHADRIDTATLEWTKENRKDRTAQYMVDIVQGGKGQSFHALLQTAAEADNAVWMEKVADLHDLINAIFDSGVPSASGNDNFFIWARNGSFDFPIVENLFRGAGLKLPWHRRQQCCVYTAQNMALMQGFIPAVTEASHQASEDCEKQVQEVIAAMSYLHNSGVAYV